MVLLRSYINEIFDYKQSVSYSIGDSFSSLVFWRGQVKVGYLNLPLHSAIAFFIGIYAVERPHLLPSLIFLGIALAMLANMTARAQHPSPWRRCISFWHYLTILRNDRPPLSVRKIRAGEGSKEAEAYEGAWIRRIEADTEAAAKQWQLQQELNEIGNERIETKDESFHIDPLARLLPYQLRIAGEPQWRHSISNDAIPLLFHYHYSVINFIYQYQEGCFPREIFSHCRHMPSL